MSGKGEAEMPDRVACPLCRDGAAKPIGSPAGIPLYRCGCSLVFQHPQPDLEELSGLYTSAYYSSWGDDSGSENAVRNMKRATFRAALAGLPAGTRPGRVLDVGCASGYFLEEARELGWEAWGVELSLFAAGIARRTFGDTVFQGTLEQAAFPEKRFDLVTMFDLLEHVPEPRVMLEETTRILADHGMILIVTPDVASLSARLMGRRWSHFKREHLWYFTRKSLEALLADCGLRLHVCRPAVKLLSLDYIARQFAAYRHPLITPLSSIALKVSPTALRNRPLPFPCGEMLVLAGKERSL